MGICLDPPYTVDPETGCWIGAWSKDAHGYCRRKVGSGPERRSVLAHRYAYEQQHGPIPEGHHVHHECENTSCVNPAHLQVLTPAQHQWTKASTRLRPEQVRFFRSLVATELSVVEIAGAHGLSPSTVSGVVNGARWRAVA